jgi:hypothetical protein
MLSCWFVPGQRRALRNAELASTRIEANAAALIRCLRAPDVAATPSRLHAMHLEALCVDARSLNETTAPAGSTPPEATLRANMASCLAELDADALFTLYNRLTARPDATRELIQFLPVGLQAIAADWLDLLEQALVQELSARTGAGHVRALVTAAMRGEVDKTATEYALGQLQAIAQWLASPPTRPDAQVTALMLETLSDDDLGLLVAQAWPDTSPAQDTTVGDEAASSAAWQGWRSALRTQLQRRGLQAATRARNTLRRADQQGRSLGMAVLSAYADLDSKAMSLAGGFSVARDLRDRLRNHALMIALRPLPAALRYAGLVKLPATGLSSLRRSIRTDPRDGDGHDDRDDRDITESVAQAIDAVCAGVLATHQQSVKDKLAALDAALARQDRAAATTSLKRLSVVVARLTQVQSAFDVPLSDPLDAGLREAVRRMRALLPSRLVAGTPGEMPDDAPGTLSDAEIGNLRTAAPFLKPFGALFDKQAMAAEIRARKSTPDIARGQLHALIDAIAEPVACPFQVALQVRDIADAMVRYVSRCQTLGDVMGTDDRTDLVNAWVDDALASHAGAAHPDAWENARRHTGRFGAALRPLAPTLAGYSGNLSERDAARLGPMLVVLEFACYVVYSLHHVCALKAGRNAAESANLELKGPRDPETMAAIGAEFGVDLDPATELARPRLSAARHERFEQALATAKVHSAGAEAPTAATADAVAEEFPLPGGEKKSFMVAPSFSHEVLRRPGISLAVSGVNERGHLIRAGFAPGLAAADRPAAIGAVLQALHTLAGGAATPLTRLIDRRAAGVFLTFLAATDDEPLVRLPDGGGIVPRGEPELHFDLRRWPEGDYLLAVTLAYRAVDRAYRLVLGDGAKADVALDPSCSRVMATFCLMVDADGVPTGLHAPLDIRYRLAIKEDPAEQPAAVHSA